MQPVKLLFVMPASHNEMLALVPDSPLLIHDPTDIPGSAAEMLGSSAWAPATLGETHMEFLAALGFRLALVCLLCLLVSEQVEEGKSQSVCVSLLLSAFQRNKANKTKTKQKYDKFLILPIATSL